MLTSRPHQRCPARAGYRAQDRSGGGIYALVEKIHAFTLVPWRSDFAIQIGTERGAGIVCDGAGHGNLSGGRRGPQISERAWCRNAASHGLCHAPRRAAIERTCSIVLNPSRILWKGLAVIRQWLKRLQFVLQTPWFCNSRTEGCTFKKRCSNCQIEHGPVTN
jgi:hypothetical protein